MKTSAEYVEILEKLYSTWSLSAEYVKRHDNALKVLAVRWANSRRHKVV